MPVTRPDNPVMIPAVDVAKDALRSMEHEREAEELPEAGNTRQLSYKQRLQRRLQMADMALEKYEKMLRKGKDLTPEQERLFLAHQDSVRKLEATLAQLEHKDTSPEEKEDAELVLDLLDRGWAWEDALRLFPHNPDLPAKVRGLLHERKQTRG